MHISCKPLSDPKVDEEKEQMDIIEAFATENRCYQEGVPQPNAASERATPPQRR